MKSKADPSNPAYTGKYLDLHSDLVFLHYKPCVSDVYLFLKTAYIDVFAVQFYVKLIKSVSMSIVLNRYD